jgi:hypothetical protein
MEFKLESWRLHRNPEYGIHIEILIWASSAWNSHDTYWWYHPNPESGIKIKFLLAVRITIQHGNHRKLLNMILRSLTWCSQEVQNIEIVKVGFTINSWWPHRNPTWGSYYTPQDDVEVHDIVFIKKNPEGDTKILNMEFLLISWLSCGSLYSSIHTKILIITANSWTWN